MCCYWQRTILLIFTELLYSLSKLLIKLPTSLTGSLKRWFFSFYLWGRDPKFILRAFPPPFVTCINITQWLWSFLLGYDLVPVTKTTINLFKFFQIISNSFAHEVWNLNRCLIFFLQCYCFKNIPLTLLDTIAGNYLNIFTLFEK